MGIGPKEAIGDVLPSEQGVVIGSPLPLFSPTHVSHKQVEAYPIAAAEFEADGSGKVGVDHPTRGYIVVPVPPRFLRNPGDVVEGDYLVRYEPTRPDPNGYLSHSPRAVFEAGYAELFSAGEDPSEDGTADEGLSFSAALHALKRGDRVCRAGWNGKSMWLSLSGPLEGRIIPASGFWSSNNRDYAETNGGMAKVLPCITMRTATGEILMGWLASQTDILSEDWEIVRD